MKIVPARRAITVRDLLTHTAGISYGTNPSVAAQYQAEGTGPGGRVRLVHRRQGRAGVHDHGDAGDVAVRQPPGEVRLRLQHRHPRLHRRARVRHAARRVHPHAHHGPLGMKDTHFFLPPAERGSPRGGVHRWTGRQDRARARHVARAGPLRRRSAEELRWRRRAALDRARLRAVSRDDAAGWRAGRRADPVAAHGRVDDDQPVGTVHSTAGLGFGYGFRAPTATARTGWIQSAPTAGAARTARRTASTRNRGW